MKSADSVIIIGAKSTSVTSSITGVALMVVPIAAGRAFGYHCVTKSYTRKLWKNKKKYKKQNEKVQQKLNLLMN